ncbi:MAG: tetratricopeptide repeat protein, partial [Bacteroidales bacterium]
DRARFLAGLSYLGLRDYDQAFALLTALAERRPAAAVYNNLGIVQLRRAAPAQGGSATYFFNKAQDLDAGDGDYDFNLGYAYLLDHDLLAAAHWLREAVRRNPSDGEAHYALGAALIGTGATIEGGREKELARRLSSAYADWDRRPGNDPVPRGLERTKNDLQTPAAARPEFAFEATEQKDQQSLAAYHLEAGRRLFAQENDRAATAELQRALYLAPYQAEAHLLLGRINLRNGRAREAIGDLKIALWSEESAAAHVALGEAYLQINDLSAARAEAQRALTLDPKSAEAKKLLERLDSAR